MARPPKDPSAATAAADRSWLPEPKVIVEREGRQRKFAIYTAIALAVATAIAVIIENLMANSVPDQATSTLIDTFGAAANGTALPASYYAAVGEWKLDHVVGSAAAATLRSLAYLLAIPVALLLLRGARQRGGSLLYILEPMVVVGAIAMAVGPLAIAIGEPGIYHSARDAGFTPGAIRDAVQDSILVYLQLPIFVASMLIGIPLAFGAMQAYRVGLLPAIFGFMGVLIGILYVIQLDSSGLLRAFWFSAVAFVIAGRASNGLPEAWAKGIAVAPTPRQPPEPRAKKPKLTK